MVWTTQRKWYTNARPSRGTTNPKDTNNQHIIEPPKKSDLTQIMLA